MSHFRPWPYPRVLAHRGGGTLAPENTLAAIRHGYERGFRAVEFDATLAADDVPVLIHDAVLGRTTSGHGAVIAHTAAQLALLDAGSWHSARFAGEPVPRLADVFAWCRAHGVWMNIEIKSPKGRQARVGATVAREAATLQRAAAESDDGRTPAPLLSSFEPAALAAAREAAPQLLRGLLVHRVPGDWAARLAALDAVALHVDHQFLSAARVREIKAAGYWLFCYTVNEPARAREILGWGVDAFCTDRIDLIGPRFAEEIAS